MVIVSSSARIESLRFDSLESAIAFLALRKLSQETVCICDIRGRVLQTLSFA
jgi:hypothetical protein